MHQVLEHWYVCCFPWGREASVSGTLWVLPEGLTTSTSRLRLATYPITFEVRHAGARGPHWTRRENQMKDTSAPPQGNVIATLIWRLRWLHGRWQYRSG